MSKRTPAEQQMEELRRLRESGGKAKLPAPPASKFELSESPRKKKAVPSLTLSPALYRRLLERQKADPSFRRKRDMGDWAAELLLALPFEAHRLSPEAKAELFQRMQAWAKARGLP